MGPSKLPDGEKQSEFERGQEYESNFQPLNSPCQGPFESNEHFQQRQDAFDSGRRSVQNNK